MLNEDIWTYILPYIGMHNLFLLKNTSQKNKNMIKNFMYNKILLYFNIDKKKILEDEMNDDETNFTNIFQCYINDLSNNKIYKIFRSINTDWLIANKVFVFIDYYEDYEDYEDSYYFFDIEIISYIESENCFVKCQLKEDNSNSYMCGNRISLIPPTSNFQSSNKILQNLRKESISLHSNLYTNYVELDKTDYYLPEDDYGYFEEEDNYIDEVKSIHTCLLGEKIKKRCLLVSDEQISIAIVNLHGRNHFYIWGSNKLNDAICDLFNKIYITHGYVYSKNKFSYYLDDGLFGVIRQFELDNYKPII